MSTTFTRGVYRYDVMDRWTGRYMFSTNRHPSEWRLDPRNMVHDTVSGDVFYSGGEGAWWGLVSDDAPAPL